MNSAVAQYTETRRKRKQEDCSAIQPPEAKRQVVSYSDSDSETESESEVSEIDLSEF